MKNAGWQIVGLENDISEAKFYKLSDPKLKSVLSSKMVLILGEEVKGISPDFYDFVDLFVEIPMKEQKESFNVSVAVGIALYGLASQQKAHREGGLKGLEN